MKKIDYFAILKRAWNITWKNKYLWWFGLIVGTSSGIGFNLPSNFSDQQKPAESLDKFTSQLVSFFQQHPSIIILGAVVLLVLMLAFFVLQTIAFAGLIQSLLAIETNKPASFKEGMRSGKKLFWKVVGIQLITSLAILVLVFVLAIPVFYLVFQEAFISATIMAILAFFILIPLLITLSFVRKYAEFLAITSGLTIRSALDQGYQIFIKNIWSGIVMALFLFVVGLALGMGIVLCLLILGTPLAAIGFLAYLAISWPGVLVIGLSGLILFLIIFLLIRSITGVFYQAIWFLFFEEIAAIKKEETIEESALAPEKLVNPERV